MKLRFRHSRTTYRGLGFTLAEVMFAVMILGIGFIMVAAIFPVAIQQAKVGRDETTAAEIAKAAVTFISDQCAKSTVMPATANLISKTENWDLWSKASGISGAVIYQPDPRYAWTALYRRAAVTAAQAAAGISAPAQVYVFVVTSSDGRPFDGSDVLGAQPNLWPRRVEVKQVIQPIPPIREEILVQNDTGAGAYPAARESVDANAFLLTDTGQIFRVSSLLAKDNLGNPEDRWQIYPGQDASVLTGWTKAWLVGRRPNGAGYEGTAQDISLYTTIVEVK